MNLSDLVTIGAILAGLYFLVRAMLRPITSHIDPYFARTLWRFIIGPPEHVSTVSVKSATALSPDEQTDEQTDQVSALFEAIEQKQLDVTRKELIDTLVLAGWEVGRVRALLKGDNAAIGAEVADARKRLNVQPEPRLILVRDAAGSRTIDING